MPKRLQQIYIDQLFTRGYGYPLWDPEPRPKNLEIGDVGYITPSGGFKVLFNARRPAENQPRGCLEVPPGFEPLELNPKLITVSPNALQDPFVTSGCSLTSSMSLGAEVPTDPIGATSAGGRLQFKIEDEIGAAIYLKYFCRYEGTDQHGKIKDYLKDHAKNWCSFARDPKGYGLSEKDSRLIFVTGFHKTCNANPAWMITAWSNARIQFGVHLAAATFSLDLVHLEHSLDWNRVPCKSHRVGPTQASTLAETNLPDNPSSSSSSSLLAVREENQCMFLNGYRLGIKWKGFGKLKAAAGYNELDGHPPPSVSPVVPTPFIPESSEGDYQALQHQADSQLPLALPADNLLNSMLDADPMAECAIVHDSDIYAMLKESGAETVDHVTGISDRHLWKIILENGCASLQREEGERSEISSHLPFERSNILSLPSEEKMKPLWFNSRDLRGQNLTHRIDIESTKSAEILSGKVTIVRVGRMDNGERVVVKFLRSSLGAVAFQSPILQLADVNHPQIVPHLGFYETSGGIIGLVSSFYENGPIDTYVASHNFDSFSRRGLLIGVGRGLCHLDRIGLSHGALHPGNVLIGRLSP